MNEEKINRKDNSDFSKGSVSGAIVRLALPMAFAQLVNVLYTLISKIYLGHLPGAGHLALSGVGITLPIIFLITSVTALCGTGGGPLFAIFRGKGDDEEAERIMGNSFTMLLFFGVIMTVLVLIFMTPLLFIFGASEYTYSFAREYLTFYSLGSIFVMISLGMNVFVNAQGFGKTVMLTTVIGASVNLVLEPVFIFALDMGVRGAALSTVAAQFCSAMWVLRFLVRKSVLKVKLSRMKPQLRRMKKIMALGVSGFIMMLTNTLSVFLANIMLQRHGGDMFVGIMAMIYTLREIISMPFFGLERGAGPVISFNYGAKLYDRVRAAIKFKVRLAVIYSAIATTLIILLPGLLLRAFSNDPALIAAGIPALRIYYGMFVFMVLQMTAQNVFVGLGMTRHAIFFSLLRKAFLVAPLTLILPEMGFGTYGVFMAEAVSQLIGGLACFLTMYAVVYRRLKKPAITKPIK